MRVANKKVALVFSALFLLMAAMPVTTYAQAFGGGTVSSLYGASNSSVFQAPGSTQQGSSGAQSSSATVLQTTGITSLAVTGAPVVAAATSSTMDESTGSSEIILLSVFAGVFALGVLYLLSRQIKKAY